MTDRTEYITGLRMLADLLESKADLPLPDTRKIDWNVWGHDGRDPKTEVARLAHLLPGRLTKNDPNAGVYDSSYYVLSGSLAGLSIEIAAERASVCEAVTTTETVTVVEKDPQAVEAAIADIPEVEVTKEVSVTEWVCSPLLAEAAS